MEKIFTIEFDQQGGAMELHIDKAGAEYLRGILDRLISNDKNEHVHLMTPDWGGDELSSNQQNLSADIELLHQLKIMYWSSSSIVFLMCP